MDYSKFSEVLEYIPKSNIPLENDILNESSILFTSVINFCTLSKKDSFIVSLSGGVDSMVLISLLKYLHKNVVAVHINYHNRAESNAENAFLKEWCYFNRITLYTKHIEGMMRNNTINRSSYEDTTKTIRFAYYEQVMKEENIDSVLLAHHKDDVVENIFTNICRGRSIVNLANIKPESVINNVRIVRPLLNIFKEDIYNFAHENDIPYFKDSTPPWSVRGMFRNVGLKCIRNIFGHNVKTNLLNFNQETVEWNELIDDVIMIPFITTKCTLLEHSIDIDISQHKCYPFCFWNTVMMNLCHKYNHSCPSRKSIQNLLNIIQNKSHFKLNLTSKCYCVLQDNIISIKFKS